MKKQYILFSIIALLLIVNLGNLSATTWTKSTDYDKLDMRKVTFENWWGLGEEQGSLELKSHQLNEKGEIETLEVGVGKQVVMYYDFNFKKLIRDGLGDVEFINMKTGEYVDKDYKFVYWFEEERVRDVCLEYEQIDNSTKTLDSKNETTEPRCLKEGTETYTFSEWRDYNSRDIPTSGRIGIEVETKQGEYIDGIWNLGSKRLTKHAEWTASLENDLISYYKLDETSGDVIDSHGSNNGTNNGATRGVTGKIENAFDFDGSNDYVSTPTETRETMSFSWWRKGTEPTAWLELSSHKTGNDQGNIGIGFNADGIFRLQFISTNVNEFTDNVETDALDGNWHHAVVVVEKSGSDTIVTAYLDGEFVEDVTISSASLSDNFPIYFGAGETDYPTHFNAEVTLDEIGIWHRALTSSEVTDLYNDGDGLGYQQVNMNITLLNPENNTITNEETIDFSANVTDVFSIEIQNVSLYIDGVLEQTNSSGVEGVYNFTETLGEGDYNWSIKVFGYDNETYESDVYYLTVDLGAPDLTASVNETILYAEGDKILLNTTATDDNLEDVWYSYNGTNTTIDGAVSGVQNQTTITTTLDALELIVYVNDSGGNIANEVITFTLDNIAPTIEINSGNGTFDYGNLEENHPINFTVTDDNLDSCWYEYNGTNSSDLDCSSGVLESINFPLVQDLYNLTIYSNDTIGNVNSSLVEWDYNIFANEITYNENTLGGALERFSINMTYNTDFSGITALINYNNTNYTLSSSNGATRTYSEEILVPSVSTETNITFYWIFLLTNSTGTYSIKTDEYNQTISPFLIDDCSSYSKTLLDFSMYDEETLEETNGTINIDLDIYSFGTDELVNSYNKSFTHTGDSKICLDNITDDYSMDYSIRYFTNSSYFVRYRNIQNMTINNETLSNNISLYNLKISEGYNFQIVVVGNLLSSTGNEGLLVDVQRQYLEKNKFISIQSPVTSSNGEAVASLIPNDEIYNFIISYNGQTLGTFNNYQVQCQNPTIPQCAITLNLAQSTTDLNDFEDYGGISQVFLMDRDTNTLYQTFSSTDSQTHKVNSVVLKHYGETNTTICNETSTGTSGTLTCLIPEGYRNETIIIKTYVDSDFVGSKVITQGINTEWYGVDIFIELLMFTSLVLLFLGHPLTIIIGAILGMVLPILLIYIGQASFGAIFGAVLYYIIAGGIIIWLLFRRRE